MSKSEIKVIVFDLDDTLYSELDYVRSGLAHVAKNLSAKFKTDREELYELLFNSLKLGRTEIFNRVLFDLNLFTASNLKSCIKLYREHSPLINLYQDTMPVLKALAKHYSLYIVTDGHKLVQEHKLRALRLYDSPLIKKAYITYRHGIKHSKPSPYCFNKIVKSERVMPNEVVYIGDNPKKDFVGIKPLGFKTIRVLTGQHKDAYFGDSYEAEFKADNLIDAKELLKLL